MSLRCWFTKCEAVLHLRKREELLWLAKQIRPLVPWHIAAFFCGTVGSLLALITPLVLKWLIDQVLPRRETRLFLLAAVLIFISYQGRAALTSLGNYLTLTAVQKTTLRLRMDILRHLDRLSADYYESTPPGAVMYPLKEPIEEVAYFGSDLVPAILRLCLTTIFTVVAMFVLSPVMTLAIIPLIPVFLIARNHFRTRLSTDSDRVQSNLIGWNGFLEEHVSSAVSIQLLCQEARQERKAFRLLARTTRSYLALFRTGIWFTTWTSMAVALAMSAVIGCGGWSVVAGSLSIGSLVAFYSFVTQLFDPLSGAAELYARSQRMFASIRQLQAVFDLRPTITNPSVCAPFPPNDWGLQFRAVEFGYERSTRRLLIPSLRIAAGERVAIVGENGAGKSTLARLVTRLYDIQSGSIEVGGMDIRDIGLRELRRQVCYLPRDPVLFEGSLASNLRFVRPGASDGELLEAIELADLAAAIATLPAGIHQRLGPDACQLSGGQRQRLAIARALLQRPRILMLDEATSCLDPAAEALILHNVARYLPASTLIVVSHRVSTLSDFTRVLVLSSGGIAADLGPDTLSACEMLASKRLSFVPAAPKPD